MAHLPPEQLDALQTWLFTEKVKFAEAVTRLRDRFNVSISITALARFYRHLERQQTIDEVMTSPSSKTGDWLALIEIAKRADSRTLYKIADTLLARRDKPTFVRLAAEKVLDWVGDDRVRQIASSDADRAAKLDQVESLIFAPAERMQRHRSARARMLAGVKTP